MNTEELKAKLEALSGTQQEIDYLGFRLFNELDQEELSALDYTVLTKAVSTKGKFLKEMVKYIGSSVSLMKRLEQYESANQSLVTDGGHADYSEQIKESRSTLASVRKTCIKIISKILRAAGVELED